MACRRQFRGFSCTLPLGHRGPCIAHGIEGAPLRSWRRGVAVDLDLSDAATDNRSDLERLAAKFPRFARRILPR
jgi:hypothetical protein